jgi:hypothetical protein
MQQWMTFVRTETSNFTSSLCSSSFDSVSLVSHFERFFREYSISSNVSIDSIVDIDWQWTFTFDCSTCSPSMQTNLVRLNFFEQEKIFYRFFLTNARVRTHWVVVSIELVDFSSRSKQERTKYKTRNEQTWVTMNDGNCCRRRQQRTIVFLLINRIEHMNNIHLITRLE